MYRGGRTSAGNIFVRGCIIVFVISWLLAMGWNAATGTKFWGVIEIAIASVLIVVFYGGFAWLVTNLGMNLMNRNNANYQRYKQSGGDPYLDILPKPFNPDSETTRTTGLQEPKTKFVPPKNWIYQCPVCGARQPSQICVCWHCNYGADGDSTAYYARWGGKPEQPSSGCEGGSCSQGDDNSGSDGYDGWIPVDEQPRPPSS